MTESQSNRIAIVGRPNVGKSALFNCMAGRRIAIVHDQPGVTRDRISAPVEWQGRQLELVDTGGIGLLKGEKAEDPVAQAVSVQVELAIEEAGVIILVTDVKAGITPLDEEIAGRLREAGKEVVVAVNKCDNPRLESQMTEFASLGLEPLFAVSAAHDRGVPPLMQTAVGRLPPAPAATDEGPEGRPTQTAESPIKLAIIGRPNVGKSSMINALIQSERVIVNDLPGTTRDSVDVPLSVESGGQRDHYLLIDTAGLRKRRRVHEDIEFYGSRRAEDSIKRSDMVLLVLDATMGITEQDKKIGDLIVSHRKACIIVVNKWDLYEPQLEEARREERERRKKRRGANAKDQAPMLTLAEFAEWVQRRLFFLHYAPVIFSSATSGLNLDRLLEATRYVRAQWHQKVPTAVLNRVLQEAMETHQPVSTTGQRLKFYYATQKKTAPPTFLLFVNRNELLSENFTKYLTGRIRDAFGFEGCPIVLSAKPRPRDTEPGHPSKAPGPSRARKAKSRP